MKPEEVVSFWEQAGENRWFFKDPAFDGALNVRFGSALSEARQGAFDHWGDTPEGALGLVLLLDQISRNVHRGSPLAFAADAKALFFAKEWISRGYHRKLVAPRAQWLLMPFEHRPFWTISPPERRAGPGIHPGGTGLPEGWWICWLVSDSALPRSFRLTTVEFASLMCAQFNGLLRN
jgi:Bacterial protein of unknown function (DUF924)